MLLQFLRYSSILLFVVNKPKISTITVFKYYNHELSNIIQTIVNQKVKKKTKDSASTSFHEDS